MLEPQFSLPAAPKPGRPRRGTETHRTSALLDAATRVFLREGYGSASIDKVAAQAGVSTRTIYERFKNKADLMGAVISRLVDRMSTVLTTADLGRLAPKAALGRIAQTIVLRARDPDSAALFRIVAGEAHRFPELAAKMRETDKRCVNNVVAEYLRGQIGRGELTLSDPDRAATLFLQMICSELHESLLFGEAGAMTQIDCQSHIDHVIEIFLLGAAPRQPDARTHVST
jgi:TetR/AcrR family transcriptional regulator, mexJK operon transcriptional repressor